MNSSSTLVATVSINYEDFTEGFLTCGTCLCTYDQDEHMPKLLSCSHTICRSCLELIATTPTLNNSTEAGCIKCPICRQNIAIPSGGIGALPASFIVNQLYDLVNKNPREFIPKCSVHIEQELLFCETCDCVFCDTCNKTTDESDDSLTAPSSLITTTTVTTTSTNTTAVTAASSTTASRAGSIRHHQQNPSISGRSAITSSLVTTPASNHSAAATTSTITANPNSNTKQHISEACTVIPFSTAIKRMSEILNYRSQQCLSKLDEARDNVQREIDKLEANCSDALHDIEQAFVNIKDIIESREKVLLEETNKLHEYKKNVLQQQLKSIEDEKSSLSVESSVRINNETDVKNLSRKISDLTEKNDAALALYTPRENCFICYENENEKSLDNIQNLINSYGNIRTSKTYPPYCTSKLIHYSTHLKSLAIVQSVDYNGDNQKFGGDPIQAELRLIGFNEAIDSEIEITDKRDGTYEVSFVPPVPGEYQLFIYIFNRPIKNCPLTFETSTHHNPIAIFGRSSKKEKTADQFDHFNQPASLIINKHNGRVFILDSFNNRIKVLAQIDSPECPFSFMQHIQPDFFSRCCTGIALLYPDEDESEVNQQNHHRQHGIQNLSLSPTKPPNPNILVTDWRNRVIYELNLDGKLLRQLTHDDLAEPTNIVVDSRGRIFVVDRETIFVFSSSGRLLNRLNGYKYNVSGRQTMDETNSAAGDSASLKKIDPFSEPEKLDNNQLQQTINGLAAHLAAAAAAAAAAAGDATNKESLGDKNGTATATLNSYLIRNCQDKRAQAKTNTLTSFISIKRKPKINPGSSIQWGSKAVISAASRIRSTFTLSHSTSLVGAVSLQSMFNNSSKQHQMSNQQPPESHTVVAQNGVPPQPTEASKQQPDRASNGKLPPCLNETSIKQTSGAEIAVNDQSQRPAENNTGSAPAAVNDESPDAFVEPFGIIRGIAIGSNDELVVADESRVRVLELSGNDYVFKRELLVPQNNSQQHAPPQTNAAVTTPALPGTNGSLHNYHHNHHHHHHHHHNSGRLCAMTYDATSKLLLILRAPNFAKPSSNNPFIQIVDYETGLAKFNIDSFESKLICPSSLSTFGQHAIVTDLGSDCIKKYRFY